MVESKSGNFTNDFNAHSEKMIELASIWINKLAVGSE
jgi:hypothetical protein